MEKLGTDAIWTALKHHPTFAGCFPADKIPHVKSFPTAFIVNTEKYGEEGEHWVAFYMEEDHCLYFDSFGVGVLEHPISSYLSKYYNSVIYSKIPVQDFSSVACGYFCIAFLVYVTCVNSYFHFLSQFNFDKLKSNDVICYNLLRIK